jgi:DNA end-binding protein Ku
MRVAEGTEREVDYDDIVKGYELESGEYVMLTQEELEPVEPGKPRTIEIIDFVELSEIDPIYFEKSPYLAPKGEGGEKAYALLVRAMEKSGLAGVASFVMRAKQYLATIRPREDVLVLETMFFADEVRDADKVETLPVSARVGKRELDVAVSLIGQLKVEWDPERYHDSYRDGCST